MIPNNITMPHLGFMKKSRIYEYIKLVIPCILLLIQLLIPTFIQTIEYSENTSQFLQYQKQYTWHEWKKGKRIQKMLDRKTYDIIKEQAKNSNFPLHYALAFAYSESRFNYRAKSYAGALGMFQIMAKMHKCDPKKLVDDPEYNTKKGIGILKWCFKLARGDIQEAAKNYNAGPYGTYYNKPYIREIKNNIMKSATFADHIEIII